MNNQLGSMRTLALAASGALAAIGGTSGVRKILAATDSLKGMQGRLSTVTGSSEEAAKALDTLFNSAEKTRASIEPTVTLYASLAAATENMGYSQNELVKITESVNRAMAISGTSAASASGAVTQLGQAFASGVLRGDEFNSVNEAAPRIMKAVADSLGVSRGALRSMAEAGELTADVVGDALLGSFEELRSEIDKMPQTIDQAAAEFENRFIESFGKIDTSAVVSGINSIADALTDPSFQQSVVDIGGGAIQGVVLLADNIEIIATLLAAKFVPGMAAAAAASLRNVAAAQAAAVAEAEAAAALVRRTAAEKQSALAMLASARLDVQATAGTNAHAFALNQLSVARVRATNAAGAHNAATAASTAAMGRASIAARALSGSMALIGGPAGAAILAAYGLYKMADSLQIAEGQAEKTEFRVGELTGKISDLSKKVTENKITELKTDLADLELQAAATAGAMESAQESANSNTSGGILGVSAKSITQLGQAAQAQSELTVETNATKEAIADLEGHLKDLAKEAENVPPPLRQLSQEAQALTKAVQSALGVFQSLRAEFDPAGSAIDEYSAKQMQLKLLLDNNKISAENYLAALNLLGIKMRETIAGGDMSGGFMGSVETGGVARGQDPFSSKSADPMSEWLESARAAFTDFEQLSANAAQNFTSSFGQAFATAIQDSDSLGDAFRSMADGMVTSILTAVGEMIAQWAVYQAVQLATGKATQAAAVTAATSNALAAQQMAAINAYSSTAAIPITGPAMAPAAAATALAATAPYVAGVTTNSIAGMAHDGIDSVPSEGTWLLDKGERVVDSRTNEDLKTFLNSSRGVEQGAVASSSSGGGDSSVEVVNYITVQASDGQSTEDAQKQGAEIGKTIKAVVLKTINEQKRPGGALASVGK
jgi:tape measure domain-containing protein